jgi:seryl-tRNA synthetase
VALDDTLLPALLERGLLAATGVPGVYARGAAFEDVVQRFDEYVSRELATEAAELVRFPPVLPRRTIERSGYLKSFPHLAGTIFSYGGDERGHADMLARVEAGEDWSASQSMTDVVLVPAACYPVYPYVAAGGVLPPGGRTIDVASYCFRNEPSDDPARMQAFRMHELVRIGAPAEVEEWQSAWIERGLVVLGRLGLAAESAPANDPFFGRGGRLLAANQRAAELKFELLAPIAQSEAGTAIMSVNYHQDHFGSTYDIRTATGEVAHSACLGFGLERVTLALLVRHGHDPAAWPGEVRRQLWGQGVAA